MDRSTQRRRPADAPTEPAATAWTSHDVWQDRVQSPRAPARSQTIILEQPATGWDPTETWRIRVKQPRDRNL
jgi:hypothetical protein